MGVSWGVSVWDMGLPWSSLPLSTGVICVGHPLRLVVGIWSRVHRFLGVHGAGRRSHGIVGLALGGGTG